jgi:glutamate decarboxylase
VVIQRILVRQGVSRDLATMLVQNMWDAIEYFKKRPVKVALTAEEASGFHH